MRTVSLLSFVAAMAMAHTAGLAQESDTTAETEPRPTLYVVATAHLDTQWLWTIQDTINEYVPNTLRENFALFEKYPHYVFSFEGAFRYMLAREYYPEEYARLKEYIAAGRWNVCGSAIDGGDVNVPSPEALIRHVLYANGFFRREFGKTSTDLYLPDCFGFGYALPSIAAHCGLKGFSTQKLTWGSSVGIPFDVGVWEGVDGSSVIAALNPGAYVSTLREDLSASSEWLERINSLGEKTGAYVGYKYFGVGDVGGGPDDESVEWLEKSIAGNGPIRVINVAADQLYQDLTAEQVAALPRYKGELVMTRHGVGCYTSQAAMKRWNRKNEMLADSAERASVIADWLGAAVYPREKLRDAWVRFLWHHMHDDLPGTCIPQAYTFSWNDEILSLNQFSSVLTDAVGGVARALDTQTQGVPLVVYNPLSIEREDVVEAEVSFPNEAPQAIRVFGPSGKEVPSQLVSRYGNTAQIVFLANVPSVGFAVFDVRPSDEACAMETGLRVDEHGLENERYRVRFDAAGDIAGIHDKRNNRELLAAPHRLQLLNDAPNQWPEWEIDYDDVMAEPREYVGGPVHASILERGPARVTLELSRQAAGSTFVQRIRLAPGGAADRIEIENRLDWRSPHTCLKAAFPLAVSNANATYDLGLGTIQRPNNTEELYEVPAQQWADLTARDGEYGVGILNDCKYGWDKPADNVLRLTLIHSPHRVQKDMGWHRFTYALTGHQGDWRRGLVSHETARLNQPLTAFQTRKHDGALGRVYSMLELNTPQVAVRAFKKAEDSDEVVIRLQELYGRPAENVTLSISAPIVRARTVTGAETPLDEEVRIDRGRVMVNLKPYEPRTLALDFGNSKRVLAPPVCKSVPLPFDADVISLDGDKADGAFDSAGHTLPGELLPKQIVSEGIEFTLGLKENGQRNAVTCRGQTIPLPEGEFDRVYLLMASAEGDTAARFRIGDETHDRTVQSYSGFVGQSQSLVRDGRVVDAARMTTPYIKTDEVSWVGTHRHAADGQNEPYVFCYLFKHEFDLAAGSRSVTLPQNEDIRILAITLAENPNADTKAATALYDRFALPRIEPPGGLSIDPVTITMTSEQSGAEIRYTLDGSEPGAASKAYAGPFPLSKAGTIKARVFVSGRGGDFVARRDYRFVEPRTGSRPENPVGGLRYEYFEEELRQLPDFDALEPKKTGTCETISLEVRDRDLFFAVRFVGHLRVPRTGIYTFYTRSDDGSKLFIGSTEVVDNDGLHGAEEQSGEIALAAGMHPIEVQYFQQPGDFVLEVEYEGPELPRQPIPGSALFHSAELDE